MEKFEQSEGIIKDLFNQGYTSWSQETIRSYPLDTKMLGIKRGQCVMIWELKKERTIVTICYIYNKQKDNILRYDADEIHIYYNADNKLVVL